jgi:hypothetical protein
VAFGPPGGDIGAPAPDGSHEMQLLGDLVKRGLLGKPLKGIHYSLFVRHDKKLLLCGFEGKRRGPFSIASVCNENANRDP